MDTIHQDIRTKVHRICSDYLGGVWSQVSPDDIVIQKFTGGFINLTMKLSLPYDCKPLKNEPITAVMKIKHGFVKADNISKMTENIIVVILAEKGLAPKVYGIFEDGHLDEYIEGRPLTPQDFQDSLMLKAIARKLAQFHSLILPLNKDPDKIYNQCKYFLELALNDPRNEGNVKRKKVLDKLLSLNPAEELTWIKKVLKVINPPIVFSHGDLQVNNILLRKNSPNDPLHIIDYDLSGYNYRGHDFSSLNHSFCLTVPYPKPPYVKYDRNYWPSLSQQKFIISNYLQEIQKIKNEKIDFEKEEKRIMNESKICSLLFFYFILIHSFNQNDSREKTLDWLEFSDILLDCYVYFKNEWFSELYL